MLAKCLWKMYNYDASVQRNDIPIQFHEVIDSCIQAIEALPERRDHKQEPILEPHYKLVSIVHKLVERQKLQVDLKHQNQVILANQQQPMEASKILQATPYARKTPHSEEMDTWESYILQVLKALRTGDKANWHHRMVARVRRSLIIVRSY